jgi:hypothetical protein
MKLPRLTWSQQLLPFPPCHSSLPATHHIPTQLRTFAGLPGLRAHFVRHYAWDFPTIFDLIDWPVFHAATLATTFLKRLFIITWINSLLSFQKQQFRYQQSPSSSCPSACGCTEEDWHHFPRCPHLQRKQSLASFIPTISATIERWKLDPGLRCILLHLLVPLTSLPPIPLTQLPAEYTLLLTTQRSIGEDSLLHGFFSED